jgi:hypothetical protein
MLFWVYSSIINLAHNDRLARCVGRFVSYVRNSHNTLLYVYTVINKLQVLLVACCTVFRASRSGLELVYVSVYDN